MSKYDRILNAPQAGRSRIRAVHQLCISSTIFAGSSPLLWIWCLSSGLSVFVTKTFFSVNLEALEGPSAFRRLIGRQGPAPHCQAPFTLFSLF